MRFNEIIRLLIICVVVIILVTVLSFSYNLDILISKDLLQHGMKVVGIGLPRTGTCSLATALRMYGLATQHFPINLTSKRELYDRKRSALVDITMLGFRPADIYRMYPDAVLIYTDRCDKSWVRSMMELLVTLKRAILVPGMANVVETYMQVFGSSYKSILAAKRLYEREIFVLEQQEGVKVHRISIADRDITSKEKWESLETALNHSGNNIPFSSKKKLRTMGFPNEGHVITHIKQAWRLTQ